MNLGYVAVALEKEEAPDMDKRRAGDKNMSPALPPNKPPDKKNKDINVDRARELQRICAELCGGER